MINRNRKSEPMKTIFKHQIALAKDGEKYIFRFDDASHKALLRVFGRYADSEELSFTWHDAAVLTKKVREDLRAARRHSAPGDETLSPQSQMTQPRRSGCLFRIRMLMTNLRFSTMAGFLFKRRDNHDPSVAPNADHVALRRRTNLAEVHDPCALGAGKACNHV